MKRLIVSLILVTLLLVPVACARAEQAIPAEAPPMPAPAAYPKGETVYYEEGVTEERMIVRTGEMALVVEEVTQACDAIAQRAVSFDGYVVSA